MPSSEPLPTLQELLDAFEGAVTAKRAPADVNRGALYDLAAGTGALLFLRQAHRDQDEFRALYFANAQDERLTKYVELHFPGKGRIGDEPGPGLATLTRPSVSAGAGRIYEGTRVVLGASGSDPLRRYLVVGHHSVAATQSAVELPIKATVPGAAGAIDTRRGEARLMTIEDELWDTTWTVQSVVCSPGTERERNEAFRARIRQERTDDRPGYETKIAQALRACGAQHVLFFRSDYLGEDQDFGLNRIYVGDSNFEADAALLRACRLALPMCAVAGTSVQALPMGNADLEIAATVRFWSDPTQFDTTTAVAAWRAATVEYFASRENPFLWSEDALRGAMLRAYARNVQQIELDVSQPEPVVSEVVRSPTIIRHRVAAGDVSIQTLGPS